MKMRGKFIVFDGIDGSGKSTQAKMLFKLLSKNQDCILTHEPSRKTSLGKKITKLTKIKKLGSQEWLKLFTEDRKYHIKNEILPALKKGKIVISDRYYYSTLAYQLPKNEWSSYVNQFITPDIAFICVVSPKIALRRITKDAKTNKDRGKISVFEKLKTLKKLREKYLQMKIFNEVRIIDSRPSPKEIFKRIKKEIENII